MSTTPSFGLGSLARLPHTTVLADAARYDVVWEPEYAIDVYAPPLGLVEQLRSLGVEVESVEHVRIIPAPGETRGHQVVRIHSGGETLYAVGDLYHHPIELRDPTWHVAWARAETIAPSRRMLVRRMLEDDARVVATHIPSIGRLRRVGPGVEWMAS